MLLKSLILQCLSSLFLISNSAVHCKPEKMEYHSYLINALQHIENQPGWSSMMHLYLKHDNDEISNVSDFLSVPTTSENFKIKFQLFACFINCRYAELLYTFNTLLENFLIECNKDLSKSTKEAFIFCASQLINMIKNSAEFFKKLSATISFIDQIDLRIVDPEMKKTNTIVDDIINYLRFFIWKDQQTHPLLTDLNISDLEEFVLKEYNDVRRFQENNAIPKLKVLMDRVQLICIIIENKDLGGPKDELVTDGSLNDVSEKLDIFFHQFHTKDYEEMGFEQLIYPNKFGKLIPPTDHWWNSDVQEFFKRLVTYPGWSDLNYIKVKKYNVFVGIDYIKSIDKDNFARVQSYFFTLVKCRYTEIVYNFYFMVKTLIQACYGVNQYDSGARQAPDVQTTSQFVRCAVYVHDSMKVSVNMFERMLIALHKLRMSSRFNRDRECTWPVEAIIGSIVNFVDEFEFNNYTPNDFNEVIASEYLVSLNTFIIDNIIRILNSIVVTTKKYCQSSVNVFEETYLENKLSTSLRLTPEEPNVSFKKLYRLLIKFYHDVITNDFKRLGFHENNV